MNRRVQYRNVGECVCNIRKRGGGWKGVGGREGGVRMNE